MGLQVITPPGVEPIAVAEAKAHARILTDADDAQVAALVRAARRHAEARCNRSFAVQTYEATLDAFPGVRTAIELPRPPLVAVDSVTYVAGDGTPTVLDPSSYRVVPGTPGVVEPAVGSAWPTAAPGTASVFIRYSAGWPTEQLPEDARLAMLMLIAHWYDRREPIVVGSSVAALPFAVDALLGHVDWRTRG